MKNILLYVLVLLLFFSCDLMRKHEENPDNSKKTGALINKKYLTIILIDISGSFNKIQTTGGFRNKNYFIESCNEVLSRIRYDIKLGQECLMIKAIQSVSFKDDALVYKIDLSNEDKYMFSEPPPDDDIMMKRWEIRKSEFERSVEEKVGEEKDKAVKALIAFKDNYTDNGTPYTDLINAFNGVKPQLESKEFTDYIKKIIVYSDFKETKNKNITKLVIKLDNISIEGRFVSKNEYESLEMYEKNKAMWRKILKCKAIVFKTPEETIK
jgi:hypothetical protein